MSSPKKEKPVAKGPSVVQGRPGAARADGKVEKYGLLVPAGTPSVSVELLCYRDAGTEREVKGNLGAEQHFRNAWRLMWPDYEWSEWVDLLIHAWCNYKWIMVIGHQRASKCLGKGTPVMLYDGTVIPVEDVQEGMLLMGDDSTPRKVLSLARGREMLYKVKSSRRSEWICNESHTLSFKCSRDIRHRNGHLTHKAGELIDIPLTEFKKKGEFWRSVWKQYQVPVDFPKPVSLPVDPYVYGSWLAEGGKGMPCITSYDGPMVRKWCSYWESRGGRIAINQNKNKLCPTWFVRYNGKYDKNKIANPCTDLVRKSVIDGQKRVIRDYMYASREDRLALLAGYLDGDGCAARASFAFQSVDEGLARDLVFICRSLGFYTSCYKRKTTCKSQNYVGEAWQVYVSGALEAIPTLQKKPRKGQSNDPTCQSITVEPIGEGDYYGFEVDGNHRFLLGDCTVTHNSYTMAFALFLDYCADPLNTLTTMGTVTFDGLRIRMWSDLQRAAETAALKFPFSYRSTTNELRVYVSEAQGEAAMKYQIHGMAMNNSKDAEGRVRGGHAPRRRLALDEAENVSDPIYEAMINPMSAPDSKAVLLCNPMEKVSKFGQWCEPKDGWESVSPSSLMWECKAARSVCIHLDGLQSPNVKLQKAKFTGLLTQENVDETLARFGENSLQWWSLIRGWFPPDGLVARIFPSNTIERARKNLVFEFAPRKCATLDPAFEHDQCVIHFGDLGPLKRGDKLSAINATESMEVKLKIGPEYEPKDYQIAHTVMEECQLRGILPQHFIMDRTGGGRGVFAILQKEWSMDVQGIDYGGKATERNLRADDDRQCDEIYKYFVTELWFRAAEFCKEGLIGGLDNLHDFTTQDLTSRRYVIVQGGDGILTVAESKLEVKKRLGRSPDHGDAFVQFGELLERLGTRPGLPVAPLKRESGRWTKHREKARELAASYSDDKAYSHHQEAGVW